MKWSGTASVLPVASPQNLADDIVSLAGSSSGRRYPFCGTHTTTCIAVRTEANTLESTVGPAPTATINLLMNGVTLLVAVPAPPAGTSVSVPIVATFNDGDDIEVQVSFTGVNETSTGRIDVEVVVEFQGPSGVTGPTGPSGGPVGPTGPAGTAAGATIIAFGSGPPVTLDHVVSGTEDRAAVTAFGSSFSGVNASGVTIDLTGGAGIPSNMAWSQPRDGTLTQLSVFFSFTSAVAIPLGTTVSIRTEIYRSTTPNNVFSPTGVLVDLPLPTNALISIGDTFNGTAAAALAVNNQDRLLLVTKLIVTGTDIDIEMVGYVSAGLLIA